MAREVLTDEAVCGNILIAVTLKASALSNSLMMPFFVLPELLSSNPMLGQDDELLDSIAWECLRHNGPGLKKMLRRKNPLIPTAFNLTCIYSLDGDPTCFGKGQLIFTLFCLLLPYPKLS